MMARTSVKFLAITVGKPLLKSCVIQHPLCQRTILTIRWKDSVIHATIARPTKMAIGCPRKLDLSWSLTKIVTVRLLVSRLYRHTLVEAKSMCSLLLTCYSSCYGLDGSR